MREKRTFSIIFALLAGYSGFQFADSGKGDIFHSVYYLSTEDYGMV